jgi:hypothetical protein
LHIEFIFMSLYQGSRGLYRHDTVVAKDELTRGESYCVMCCRCPSLPLYVGESCDWDCMNLSGCLKSVNLCLWNGGTGNGVI